MLAVLCFSFLVWDNLDGANDMIPKDVNDEDDDEDKETSTKMPFHSIVIRIVSSYLQTAGILLKFDLSLPPSVLALVAVESSSSSLSEQLLLFDCGTSLRNDRDLFVLKQMASVWITPLCSIFACVACWTLAHFVCLNKKKGNRMTGLDGFISSLMILFYTLFPLEGESALKFFFLPFQTRRTKQCLLIFLFDIYLLTCTTDNGATFLTTNKSESTCINIQLSTLRRRCFTKIIIDRGVVYQV